MINYEITPHGGNLDAVDGIECFEGKSGYTSGK